MQWPSAAGAGRFFGLASGGLYKAPSLKCHPGLLGATLEFCPPQRPSHSGGAKQSPVCSTLGTWVSHSPEPLRTATGAMQHPCKQGEAVSTILYWAQTVPDGLGEPRGSAAWMSPQRCPQRNVPPFPGNTTLWEPLLYQAPCLGRARAIRRQLRLVQRTRVGLSELFMSCCDLSWPEPCLDQTVPCAFSLPWLQLP